MPAFQLNHAPMPSGSMHAMHAPHACKQLCVSTLCAHPLLGVVLVLLGLLDAVLVGLAALVAAWHNH